MDVSGEQTKKFGGQRPSPADPIPSGVVDGEPPVGGYGSGEADACIGGARTASWEVPHRGRLSDVEVSEWVDIFHELEEFVRRNPWPVMALGFFVGYVLSRSKGR